MNPGKGVTQEVHDEIMQVSVVDSMNRNLEDMCYYGVEVKVWDMLDAISVADPHSGGAFIRGPLRADE